MIDNTLFYLTTSFKKLQFLLELILFEHCILNLKKLENYKNEFLQILKSLSF